VNRRSAGGALADRAERIFTRRRGPAQLSRGRLYKMLRFGWGSLLLIVVLRPLSVSVAAVLLHHRFGARFLSLRALTLLTTVVWTRCSVIKFESFLNLLYRPIPPIKFVIVLNLSVINPLVKLYRVQFLISVLITARPGGLASCCLEGPGG
jgi:hypothetical protein